MSRRQFLCTFFNDTATTEIYSLSLHDALPISFWTASRTLRRPSVYRLGLFALVPLLLVSTLAPGGEGTPQPDPKKDRKSTRLNSSHANISYAVFCLKKK